MSFALRHSRFMVAFILGIVSGLVAYAFSIAPEFALLIAVDAFFLIYLALTARIVRSIGADDLRSNADRDDEGLVLILLLAALAVLVSVIAIFLVLNAEASSPADLGLALISLPLGWATVHTLAAFHYAHLHYLGEEPGFLFPGKGDPDALDFLYASFTIGMTAQVSDVEVGTRPLRRAVLVHGVASFFYNTCILALAVNAALTAGS